MSVDNDADVRCFIAVDIPARQQQELWRQCRLWRQRFDAFRWGNPSQYHLTVAFLGNQPQTLLATLAEQLAPVVARLAASGVVADQLELFPARRPHVVAARLVPTAALNRLYRRVNEVCTACGIEVPQPSRSFHPHITVARFHRHSFHETVAPLKLDLTIPLTAVKLFASELTPDGAVHRVVERFLLHRG